MRRGKRGTTGASVDHRYCVLLPTDPSVGTLRRKVQGDRNFPVRQTARSAEMNSTASRRVPNLEYRIVPRVPKSEFGAQGRGTRVRLRVGGTLVDAPSS